MCSRHQRAYGADPASLAAIKSAYTTLIGENRLFIPAHVAREIAKNRPDKLKTLYDQLAQRQSANITAGQYPPLLAGVAEYETLQKTEVELLSKMKEYREALKFFFASPVEVRSVLIEKVGNLLEFAEVSESTEYHQSVSYWPEEYRHHGRASTKC